MKSRIIRGGDKVWINVDDEFKTLEEWVEWLIDRVQALETIIHRQ